MFKALGLSVAELKSQDPAEALRRVAVALSGFADDGNKARAAQELFGKSLRDVAPFLADLATQGALVATVTTAQAEAAEKFNQQLSQLEKNALDAKRALFSGVVEGLNATADAYRLAEKQGDSFLTFLLKQTTIAQGATKALESIFGPDKRQGIAALTGGGFAVGSAVNDRARARILRQSAGRPSIGNVSGTTGRAAVDPAERYLEGLQRQLEAESKLTSQEQVLQDVQQGRIKLSEQQLQQALFLARLADKSRERTAKERADKEATEQADRAQLDRLRELAEARTAAAALQADQLGQYAREADALVESNEQLRQQIEGIGLNAEQLRALKLARLDANIAQQEANLIAAQSIEGNDAEAQAIERRIRLLREQRELTSAATAREIRAQQDEDDRQRTDALTKSISDGILGGFRNGRGAAQIFLDELKAQFAKTVLQPAIKPIVEAGNAAIGGLLKNLLSFDGGGYTGSGARSGGLDGRGGFLGLLHPQETVVDHTRGQQAASPVVINLTVGDLASKADVEMAVQNALRTAAAVQRRREDRS